MQIICIQPVGVSTRCVVRLWSTWENGFVSLRKLILLWINMAENRNCAAT